jgi:tRNA (uracil-5-)-methyltransferase
MQCDYFGECGSCTLHDKNYEEQLAFKVSDVASLFQPFYSENFDEIKSDTEAFRARSEFKMWHDGDDKLSYAMNRLENKGYLPIDQCKIVSLAIQELMPKLKAKILEKDMKFKLFHIDFLSSLSGEMLVSLIYHRKLDETWKLKAQELSQELGIKIIGRSRKQKMVLSDDFITEVLSIKCKDYKFVQIENSFTQPNPKVNIQMIEWVMDNIGSTHGDLLELYCGAGNFTLPLASCFDKVIATEISKSSIRAALKNCELNAIENITFVRMSSEEFVQAMNKEREFTRLKDVNLDAFEIKSIFLDPPRSGLDETTTQLAQKFDTIIYISCNPQTLKRDLDSLTQTHSVEKMAVFDQFAYTNHLEMGAILRRKKD